MKDLYLTQFNSSLLPSIVYRGQFVNKNEFKNKLRNNLGGFLSINSFFSTSTNKEVALMFTGNSLSNDSNLESVLFEIKVSIDKWHRPIANIKYLSYMEQEDEILFSIATVFRIESILRLESEGIWIVCLTMNGEEDEELNLFANNIKKRYWSVRQYKYILWLTNENGRS